MEQSVYLAIGFKILQDTIWGDDEIKGPPQRKVGDVPALHLRLTGRNTRCVQLLLTAGEHGTRQVNPVHVPA
jgi:hypothetical protein